MIEEINRWIAIMMAQLEVIDGIDWTTDYVRPTIRWDLRLPVVEPLNEDYPIPSEFVYLNIPFCDFAVADRPM